MKPAAGSRDTRSVLRRLPGALLLGLDGLLAVLFAAGYLARYVPPPHLWWLQLIAIGLPYLALALGAATVAVGLARRWRLLALHLVLLGAAAGRFVHLGADDNAPTPADLTLLTYNVPPEWSGDVGRRQQALRALVHTLQPDLLALQEAPIVFTRRLPHIRPAAYVAPLLDSLAYQTRGPAFTERWIITRQPVLGRVAPEDVVQTTLSLDSLDENATQVVRARLTWAGRPFVLYNLHLRTFGETKPWQDPAFRAFDPAAWRRYLRQFRDAIVNRAWEARQIRTMLDRETLPLIVCGDFNSTPHGWVYRHLSQGLTDVYRAVGRGWGGTYHARTPFVRIDFVLVSPAWRPLTAEVLATDLSDHRPLLVRLRLPP